MNFKVIKFIIFRYPLPESQLPAALFSASFTISHLDLSWIVVYF